MRFRTTGIHDVETHLQMTPMIDIVFQLLVFFIMTFKIVMPEGDFYITMPLSAQSPGTPRDLILPPVKVEMRCDDEGELTALLMNDEPLTSISDLQTRIIRLVGGDNDVEGVSQAIEVELDCDEDLQYEYVMQAISAVSGYVTPDNKIVKLVEKLKFAPPE